MNFQISNKIAGIKPSAIREILKLSADPNIIAFSAGNPAPQAFPVEEIRRWSAEILEQEPVLALQYSVSEGYPPLREALEEFLQRRYGIAKEGNQIIVTTGAEQGLDLICKVLCNEGDQVLCESPSFVGALNTFRSYNAKLVGVEMEADGVNTEHMERLLQTNPRIKFMYLIPNFQNPTGITMSLEKRKKVLELSAKYNVPVVEDNPYGDLRFAGEDVPSIKALDTTGSVIYCGSFSKVLSPGMRVGYLCAPQKLTPSLAVAKQCTDVHTAMLPQLICHRFLTQLDFESHIARCRSIYGEKYHLMARCIGEEFSQKVQVTTPQGGLFLWCTLPKGQDVMAFAQKALAQGVAIVPGNAFLVDEKESTTSFRLNYATPSQQDIQTGIAILGRLTKEL